MGLWKMNEAIANKVEDQKLTTILQIINVESQSCICKVTKRGREGFLYFEAGELIDASLENKRGYKVAIEILSWHDNVAIDFYPLTKPYTRTIKEPFEFLLLDALRLKDAAQALTEEEISEPPKEVFTTKEPVKIHKPDTIKEHIGKLTELQNYLKEEIDGFIAAAVVDVESGITVAGVAADPDMDLSTPAAYYTETFRSAVKSFESSGWGIPKEVLMPGDSHTVILISLKEGKYYQGIATENKISIGLLRAVFLKVKQEIEDLLL